MSLTDINMNDRNVERIREAMNNRSGLIMVVGPTGAGKTTLLYALLNELISGHTKTITIEDPVEYHVPDITQIQIDNRNGRPFSSSVRSALRMDPDCLMVGELKDSDVAGVVAQAATTGHHVLTSMHVNEAAAAPLRLIQLGVPDHVVAEALSLVIAQRLVRRLCPLCKVQRPLSAIDKEIIYQECQTTAQLSPMLNTINQCYEARPEGCEHCHTGYSGRQAVNEILVVGETQRQVLMSAHRSSSAIREGAFEEGMQTLKQAALELVCCGETSLEELRRVK